MNGAPSAGSELDVETPPSPTDDQVRLGLSRFSRETRDRYRSRLRGVFLFGSRSRGDHLAHSDADVAVVLADGDWSPVLESVTLANETFEILLDFHLDIQPRVIAESQWLRPESSREQLLIRNILTDARRVDAES